MRLESERLFLYPISDEEMKLIIKNEKDPEMKRAYEEMLAGCENDPENRIWYAVWLMELKSKPGTIVGDFCFKGLGADGTVEIGYGLRDGFCGNGYMTETVGFISEWALSQHGVVRVEAETEKDNIPSQKVLASCGFVPTGENGKEGPRFALEKDRRR